MTPEIDDDTARSANRILGGLRPFPVAITTAHGGRANGMMSLSAGSAGIIDEAPRFTFGITWYNYTHDLVLESGVAAMHLLGNGALLDASLDILMTLGGRSGRDGDKMSGLATKQGVTGVPILTDAHSYVEGRVSHSLDTLEHTVFVLEVLAAEILHPEAKRLDIGEAWGKLPPEWVETYERNHIHQANAARRRRGVPEVPDH